MMIEPPLLARHLGCGDGLYMAGGVVELAKEFGGIRFPCWPGHLTTFREIFKSVPEVQIVLVDDEYQMFRLQRNMILTGIYKYPFSYWKQAGGNHQEWYDGDPSDVAIYRQMGVPLEKKWDSFPWKYEGPEPSYEKPYIFVHDDASRGYTMDLDRIGRHWTQDMMIAPDRNFTYPLTWYAHFLMGAHEIHAINSCIMWFCEFLPLPTQQRRFLHRYARPYRNCDCYQYRHHWIILD